MLLMPCHTPLAITLRHVILMLFAAAATVLLTHHAAIALIDAIIDAVIYAALPPLSALMAMAFIFMHV